MPFDLGVRASRAQATVMARRGIIGARTATTGQPRLIPLRMVATSTSIRAASIRRTTTIASTASRSALFSTYQGIRLSDK